MIKHSVKNRTKVAKNPENTPIYVEITFNSQRARYYPGFNIAVSQWDKSTQSVIRKCNGKLYENKSGQTADYINQYLTRVRVAVDKIFERYEYESKTPHPQYLLDDIRAELDDNKKEVERNDIIYYFDKFVKEKVKMGISLARKKNYITRMNQLKEYGKIRYFEDFTAINMKKFSDYLVLEKHFNNSYVVKNFTDIKVFLNWASDEGYNKHEEYLKFKQKLTGYEATRTENVFSLSSNQLMQLYNLDIEKDYLRRVRDVFCFSAFTSLRYSDVHALKWCHIHDDIIKIRMQKTKKTVTIPLNDFSRTLIERYRPMRGIFPDDAVFPVISNQKTNQYLKELGKLAGFTNLVTRIAYHGDECVEKQYHEYELLTTHVGRKTFVSTMARQGVSGDVIREFTGHRDARAMQPYLDVDDELQRTEMSKMNNAGANESVFDFDITDDERAAMGIPERDIYTNIVKSDKSIATLHLAILMHKRGDDVKSLGYVTRLPDAMKVQYMQIILIAK